MKLSKGQRVWTTYCSTLYEYECIRMENNRPLLHLIKWDKEDRSNDNILNNQWELNDLFLTRQDALNDIKSYYKSRIKVCRNDIKYFNQLILKLR